MCKRLIQSILIFCLLAPLALQAQFFDIHIHYNWDQAEVTSVEQVLSILDKEKIDYALLASTPSALGKQLKQRSKKIRLLFSPYLKPDGKKNWYRDPQLIEVAKQELATGLYSGIGEVHFMAGRLPRTDNKNFLGLLQLSQQYQLPVLIHVDASDERYYTKICLQHPKNTFLLAHAGGIYKAKQIEAILSICANTWVEFSAKDPWRYDGLTDKQGALLPDWRTLVKKYPHRFMVGTDPVWKVTRGQSWDQADDGWNHYKQLIDYHRAWLKKLPLPLRQAISYENARKLFP